MKVMTKLAMIPVFVQDQDEALRFYTEKLGLEKRTDVIFGPDLRLVTVAFKGQKKPEIALAKPDTVLHKEQRGSQFLEYSRPETTCMFDTRNCGEMYETLSARGVKFVGVPTKQLYGIEAIFEDPFGNTFSLLEPSAEIRSLFRSRKISKVGTAA